MTLMLLLVLAGPLEAPNSDSAAESSERVVFALPSVPAKARKPKGPDRGMTQLQNERSGVTCTLLVLRVDPPVDTKMVAGAPGTTADHMARNELSPCVE